MNYSNELQHSQQSLAAVLSLLQYLEVTERQYRDESIPDPFWGPYNNGAANGLSIALARIRRHLIEGEPVPPRREP